jgi:hypothetical protein
MSAGRGIAVTGSLVLALLPDAAAAADRRVPIAVMDLTARGVDPAAAGALGTEVSNALDELRVFRVITREDIKRMLQLEQTRQQCTGDADAACLAEIGGALGVDYLVYGEVARVAETYSSSLVLLDIAAAEAVNRANAKIEDVGRLLEATEQATRRLVQPLLAGKKGFLVLEAREAGAEVRVDDQLVGVTPLGGRLELAMGPHEVRVEKEGFLVWAKTVDLEPGQPTVAEVALVPSQSYLSAYAARARATRTAAWVTAGAGVVLAGAGAAFALVADARFDDLVGRGWLTRDPSACAIPGSASGALCPTTTGFENDVLSEVDEVETFDAIAVGALIAGGVSAVASAVLFATGDDPGRYDALDASPTLTAGVGRLGFRSSF